MRIHLRFYSDLILLPSRINLRLESQSSQLTVLTNLKSFSGHDNNNINSLRREHSSSSHLKHNMRRLKRHINLARFFRIPIDSQVPVSHWRTTHTRASECHHYHPATGAVLHTMVQ
jgi:hypothetical protein